MNLDRKVHKVQQRKIIIKISHMDVFLLIKESSSTLITGKIQVIYFSRFKRSFRSIRKMMSILYLLWRITLSSWKVRKVANRSWLKSHWNRVIGKIKIVYSSLISKTQILTNFSKVIIKHLLKFSKTILDSITRTVQIKIASKTKTNHNSNNSSNNQKTRTAQETRAVNRLIDQKPKLKTKINLLLN